MHKKPIFYFLYMEQGIITRLKWHKKLRLQALGRSCVAIRLASWY